MCKKLILLILFVLVPQIAAADAVLWDRAAYYDARYPSAWAGGAVPMALRDALAAAGYTILNADQLKTWMDGHIADGELSVVVLCQDIVPNTVAETMDATCTIRQYLNAGGKVVWYADWPFYYQGSSNGSSVTWGANGASNVLGFNASGGPNDSWEQVVITTTGAAWGLTETWQSLRPTPTTITANLTALATVSGGTSAAAWVKHYLPGDTYRGFVRCFDVSVADGVREPNFDDIQRLAEYAARRAENPIPADGSHVAPQYYLTNVYMILDYTPGLGSIINTAYFSDNIQDVIDRDPDRCLGSVPPWPEVSETAFVVGFDDPGIPAYARTPLVPGTTYYWCVDCNDGATVWAGAVWAFTPIPKYAWGPSPADGEDLVSNEPTCTWHLGDQVLTGYALSYNVYSGTDEAAVAAVATGSTAAPLYKGNVATETIVLANLDPLTDYFWRVDTKLKKNGPPFNSIYTKGEVWGFTTGPAGIGGILAEWWTGIDSPRLADLKSDPRYPDSPTSSQLMSSFEFPEWPTTDFGSDYGTRVHGWLYVTQTGDYTFWIATDDEGELWLSTDANPANVIRIAWLTGWVPARDWDGNGGDPDTYGPAQQMSAPIHLEADRQYYISGLAQEDGGGDYISIAWQGPDSGGVREIIPGRHLMPYVQVVAESPNPANRSVDIPLNVTLSWIAGIDQSTDGYYTTQRVYVGSDPAVVAAATTASPEYMGAPTGPNEYGPLSLSYYEKVYWRIDGVMADSGTVTYPGTVWTFKAAYDPGQVVDPNLKLWLKFEDDVLDSSGYGRHGTAIGGPTYVAGQDGQAISLDGIDDYVDMEYGIGIGGAEARTIAGWAKARTTAIGDWTDVFGFTGPSGGGGHFDIEIVGGTDSTTAGYYGVHMYGDEYDIIPCDIEWHHLAATYDGATVSFYGDAVPIGFAAFAINTPDNVHVGKRDDNANYFPGAVDDVRIYDVVKSAAEIAAIMRINLAWAWNPNPTHGATGVARDVILSWNPGDGATAHTIYFGADDPGNMVQVAGPQVGTTYDPPGDLDLGRDYYWRVVESPGMEMGRTWKFTTSLYLVVDDMETYVPWTQTGDHIFEKWRDAFGDCTPGNGNNTGSTLTENAAPVQNGLQSMKYEFDDDGTVYSPCTMGQESGHLMYSRIEAQVAGLPSGIGTNWTVGGVKALYLGFHGTAGNAVTEPFWVQLKSGSTYGNKVFYGAFEGESLDDFNEASWHDWYIDLADFGVTLSNVTSIVIGIGNENGSGAHGSGTLYIDDVRLYAPTCVPSRSSAAFALVDYAPEGARDCVVNYKELDVMTRDWLQSDQTVVAQAITTGPVARYNFENNLQDSSGNGNHGTAMLTERYAVSRPGMGMALDCNGTGDYVQTGKDAADLGIEGSNAKSTTAWVYTRAFNDGGIFDMGSNADGRDWCLRTLATQDTWRAQRWGYPNYDFDFTYPSLNEWVHMALVYEGPSTNMSYAYANGNVVGSQQAAMNTDAAGRTFAIGVYNSTSFFNGLIDDLRVYDYSLTHGQVLTAMGLPSLYMPVTSPSNISDLEAINQKKVNFKDYSVLMDSWGVEEEWPSW